MTSDIVLEQSFHSARKRHLCDHCVQPIMTGQRYMRLRGIWDGAPGVFRAHEDCHFAAEEWRHNNDPMGDEGCLLTADIQREDHWWLVNEFPEVAERLEICAWALPEYPPITVHWSARP